MSKNIIIDESGVPKNMTVDALKLNTIGRNTVLYQPEAILDLCKLTAYKSGTYNPRRMLADGFAEVVVAYDKDIKTIYSISDRKQESVSVDRASVSVQEGGKSFLFGNVGLVKTRKQNGGPGETCEFVVSGEMIEKTVTKNGTYKAKKEGENTIAYSLFKVNMQDGSGGGGGKVEPSEGGNIPIDIPYEIGVFMTERTYDDSTGDFWHSMGVWNQPSDLDARSFGIRDGNTIHWYWVWREPFDVERTLTLVEGSKITVTEDHLTGSGFTLDGDYVHVINFTSTRVDQLWYYSAPVIELDVTPNQYDLHQVAYG